MCRLTEPDPERAAFLGGTVGFLNGLTLPRSKGFAEQLKPRAEKGGQKAEDVLGSSPGAPCSAPVLHRVLRSTEW